MEDLVRFPLTRKEKIALLQPGQGFEIEEIDKKSYQQAATEYNKEVNPKPKVGVRKGSNGKYIVGRKEVKLNE